MKTRRLSMTAGNMLASLEGRKTQTRRIVKPQPDVDKRRHRWGMSVADGILTWGKAPWRKTDPHNHLVEGKAKCLYRAPGDPIVLTEVWRPIRITRDRSSAWIAYKAGSSEKLCEIPDTDAREKIERALKHGRWLPPMFMQAWASRAPAKVTEIRVERVQEISEEDAKAEGVEYGYGWEEESGEGHCDGDGYLDYIRGGFLCDTALESFRTLWDSINGKRPGCSWADNPWTWVVGYELTGERKGSP